MKCENKKDGQLWRANRSFGDLYFQELGWPKTEVNLYVDIVLVTIDC